MIKKLLAKTLFSRYVHSVLTIIFGIVLIFLGTSVIIAFLETPLLILIDELFTSIQNENTMIRMAGLIHALVCLLSGIALVIPKKLPRGIYLAVAILNALFVALNVGISVIEFTEFAIITLVVILIFNVPYISRGIKMFKEKAEPKAAEEVAENTAKVEEPKVEEPKVE